MCKKDIDNIKIQFGSDDFRWLTLEQTVKQEAFKFDIPNSVVKKVLIFNKPKFTVVMNSGSNSYTVDKMCIMLARSIIHEIREIDMYENRWKGLWREFRYEVLYVGENSPSYKIERVLHGMKQQYMQLIDKAYRKEWAKDYTDSQICFLFFGKKGEREIDEEHIKRLIERTWPCDDILTQLKQAEICHQC